jgi:hypothetical protein
MGTTERSKYDGSALRNVNDALGFLRLNDTRTTNENHSNEVKREPKLGGPTARDGSHRPSHSSPRGETRSVQGLPAAQKSL